MGEWVTKVMLNVERYRFEVTTNLMVARHGIRSLDLDIQL